MGTSKAGRIVWPFRRVFLQHAYKAGKFLAILSQPGIIRNNYERMLGVEDAGGLHQRIDYEPRGWQQRTDHVLQDVVHDRILEFVPYSFSRIFI